MSPLLALGLLVAGFCPAVLGQQKGQQKGEQQGVASQEFVPQEQSEKQATPMDSLKLASSNADFTFSLYKQLASKNPTKNVVVSPLSISMALAFLSLGARSTTLAEILEGLKFNLTETTKAEIQQGFQGLLHTLSQPSDQLQLSTGNAMFIQENLGLMTKFTEDAQRLYEAQAFTTNFQNPKVAEKGINDYVKEKTEGKIVDLIQGLPSDTVMILVNYIFFKAKWMAPFDPQDTYESKFYLSKKAWTKVHMMSKKDLNIPYFRDEALSCTVVELKYTGKASALFILPDEGQMEKVESMLLPETLKKWKDSLKTRHVDSLLLPKFHVSGDFSLEGILSQLGIKEVFSTEADLSGISGDQKLKVSQVVHKALLDVGEVGTEAAASTGVKTILMSARPIPETIVDFNRPFLMAIVHADSNVILFLSKVANPKQK